ncbi:hypothetical protein LUZ63_000132 [Rhynchospora breviuscula]|uniref:Uncharacterized protein n=1 Tax=Rhynchospora breviuscula TaxID=2022672 RepID=A0A9Q0CUR1_9POAL|nr:hypothetical protein LUZ63_000132 [Rhynchospora breviuscula]
MMKTMKTMLKSMKTMSNKWANTRRDVSESQLKTVTGSHQFKINNYSHVKGMGLGKYVNSSTFSVAGYKWAIRFYPDGMKDYSDGIACFLEFKSNAGEARTKYSLYLLDPIGRPVHQCNGSTNFSCSSRCWGFLCFIKKDIFEASSCLKDDSFTIACDVVVIKEPRSEVVPPSDIHERLSHLLSSEIGTDVAFEVNGEVLHAHRCILAASSSVFEAELFGPMKEKNMKKINILDMDASVFKAMIYFIYNDSLPEIEVKDSTTMVQNLLIAADRYALHRLMLTCEEKLRNSLDMSNVGTILALAEQHNLTCLENACLEYFSAPKTLISSETSTEH